MINRLRNILTFDNGKDIYANAGIVGINSSLELFEGYEGLISEKLLTDKEIVELCDYVIAMWSKLRESKAGLV